MGKRLRKNQFDYNYSINNMGDDVCYRFIEN